MCTAHNDTLSLLKPFATPTAFSRLLKCCFGNGLLEGIGHPTPQPRNCAECRPPEAECLGFRLGGDGAAGGRAPLPGESCNPSKATKRLLTDEGDVLVSEDGHPCRRGLLSG